MAGYTRQDTADNIANGKIIDADDLDSEFDAVESAFNSTTGHNHDGTTGEGARIAAVGPAGEMTVTSTAIQPASDNALDLGTSSVEMKDGFFDGTLKTDVLTVDETSTFTGAVTASAAVSVGTTLTVSGAATFNGNVTLGNAASDTVTITADVASHVLPSADNTYDLGASASEWRNLYIDGTANIDSLVADTADINGGTVDGSVIGGTTPAAITGTTVNGTTITASTGFSGPGGSITAINGSNIASGTVANARLAATLTSDTSGNAASATALATARNFSLTGDVTAAAVSFDGSGNVALSTTIAANSVALGTDTTGNYVSNVTAGTGISVSHSPGEGSTATVTHGNTSNLDGVYGSTDDGTKIDTITVDANGHVTGVTTGSASSMSFVLEDGDGTEVTISNSKEVKFVEGGGIDINWTDTSNGTDGDPYDLTFTHADTSSQASVNGSGRTYIQDITLDAYGHVTAIGTATETVTDTDTTYTASSDYGMVLSGTEFRLANDRRRNATDQNIKSGNTHDFTEYDPAVGIKWYTAGAEEMRLENDGDLHVDGNITAYSTTVSDARLKKDIVKIDGALDKVCSINGYTFTYEKDDKKSAGVIAQELEAVLPSAVTESATPYHGEEGQMYKTVQYDQLHGLLIEAIKELKAEIEDLKNG
jgi:hypothetical protein